MKKFFKTHVIHLTSSMIIIGILLIIWLVTLDRLNDTQVKLGAQQEISLNASLLLTSIQKRTEWIRVRATGYAIGQPYNQLTKLEKPVVSKGYLSIGGIDIFTVASDPDILPLGSIIYIDSLGIGLVTDTGPAIKKFSIDIVFNSIEEAQVFGVKIVNIIRLK